MELPVQLWIIGLGRVDIGLQASTLDGEMQHIESSIAVARVVYVFQCTLEQEDSLAVGQDKRLGTDHRHRFVAGIGDEMVGNADKCVVLACKDHYVAIGIVEVVDLMANGSEDGGTDVLLG